MVFSSIIFLFLFLPLVLTGYFLVRPRYRNFFLLISSLVFYFWGEGWLILILLISTFVNYLCALLIAGPDKNLPVQTESSGKQPPFRRTFFLIVALTVNLGFLFYFKYTNFFVTNVARGLFFFDPGMLENWVEIALPLGISFYTFQAMSYTIDVYRGVVPATKSYIDFTCYVTCFPQLVAGPIVRYKDIMHQLREREVTGDGFAEGVRRFIIGLGKKVLIANTVAGTADAVFALPAGQVNAPLAWLGVTCYTLQIYFDFSGYSDMAIGLGRMFGFRFPENFNYPYISKSIQEFWRRWHISLSTWFRDYLYIPLGGNRRSPLRTYFNLWIVFLLCGLWHGASWTFIVWGAYHGFFLVLERIWLGNALKRISIVFGHVYSLVVVMIGWIIFRSDTLPEAGQRILACIGLGAAEPQPVTMMYYLQNDVIIAMLLGILFSIPLGSVFKLHDGSGLARAIPYAVPPVLFAIFALCAMRLASGVFNPFLYFRF